MPRTGRRPGPARTRERILGAARTQFGREGYDKVWGPLLRAKRTAHEQGREKSRNGTVKE